MHPLYIFEKLHLDNNNNDISMNDLVPCWVSDTRAWWASEVDPSPTLTEPTLTWSCIMSMSSRWRAKDRSMFWLYNIGTRAHLLLLRNIANTTLWDDLYSSPRNCELH